MDSTAQPSARGGVPAFQVMRVIDAVSKRRAAGLPVIDLSAGQPSTPAPEPVRRAAIKAIESDRIGYTNALGIAPLREAIAAHYARTDAIAVSADNVAVTTGSSGGFLYAFLAAFDVGDTVAMARPGYPAYRNMLAALGCSVIELPCGAETRFQPTVAHLEALGEPPAGLVLASPANPTGTMVDAAELAALTAWCDAHGTRLISDEIYHGITFGMAAASAWRTSRRAVVVNSFSKYFSMTGWRIGWLLVPDDLADAVDRLAGNFAICPPALSQHAARRRIRRVFRIGRECRALFDKSGNGAGGTSADRSGSARPGGRCFLHICGRFALDGRFALVRVPGPGRMRGRAGPGRRLRPGRRWAIRPDVFCR